MGERFGVGDDFVLRAAVLDVTTMGLSSWRWVMLRVTVRGATMPMMARSWVWAAWAVGRKIRRKRKARIVAVTPPSQEVRAASSPPGVGRLWVTRRRCLSARAQRGD